MNTSESHEYKSTISLPHPQLVVARPGANFWEKVKWTICKEIIYNQVLSSSTLQQDQNNNNSLAAI